MARNRKYRTVAARFGPAIKAFVLCLLIGGSGVGYVWQKNQVLELGKLISAKEGKLRMLDQQNEQMRKQMADMTTVRYLEGRIRELNLGLAAPAPSQVWHLKEPAQQQGEPGGPRHQAPGQGRDQAESQYALQETRGSR
jgi:hypothetical protein